MTEEMITAYGEWKKRKTKERKKGLLCAEEMKNAERRLAAGCGREERKEGQKRKRKEAKLSVNVCKRNAKRSIKQEGNMIAQREYTRRGINMRNEMRMEFDAVSNNEGFARVAVAAFIAPLNPTLEEVSDIKTAVSEAVTNSIIHGYENIYGYGRHGAEKPEGMVIHPGKVTLSCLMENGVLYITVEDQGKGMENVEQAMEPLFTSRPELERSGMGFAFMEAFMDDLEVESVPGMGTTVRMQKKLGTGSWIRHEE